MGAESHGNARERQVREIAANLGVADFVYAAQPVRKGDALREASGDGLLIVGGRGAVLQVKARDPEIARNDSVDRAKAWTSKQVAKAIEQGRGTKRELARRQADGAPIAVLPVRAAGLDEETRRRYELIVPDKTSDWPIIVIIDHAACPEIDLGFEVDALCFSFRDWLELHRRLRSVAALLNYCQRVLTDKCHVFWGREGARYVAYRAADERSARGAPGSMPYLADAEDFDSIGADLFHDVIDKVWPHDGVVPWQSADEYRSIVEFLDAVPPQMQSTVGRWFLQKRHELASGRLAATGLVRLGGRDRLVFGCAWSEKWSSAESWLAQISALTTLRHTHALESGAPVDTVTLGIGALAEEREGRHGVSYVFVMLKGPDGALPMPADLRANLESTYGVHDHSAGTTKEAVFGRNQQCPCMSGKKYKRCCGRPESNG